MKYCSHCGKELFNEAVVCPECGTKTDDEISPNMESASASKKQKKKKIPKFVFIIGGIVLVLGIVAAILFHRPNLRANDLKMHTNPVSAVLQFGLPDEIDEDGVLRWKDCGIKFYGMPVSLLRWDPDDYHILIAVDSEYGYELEGQIRVVCDDYSISSIAITGHYKDLRFFCPYNSNYISIDFK